MFRLTTLGAIDLRDGHGRPVRDLLAQPKRVALLVWLALEGRRAPVPRERIVALFWPESDDTHARNALSQALHHIRQALGADLLVSQGAAIGIAGDRLWCDAVECADAIDRGDRELALDLYRGEFCPSLFVAGCADLEHWLDGQRMRLGGMALAAGRALGEDQLRLGELAAAARTARRALALQPDDDAAMRSLLSLLDRAGEPAAALTAYREYAHRLAAAEAAPGEATRQYAAALRERLEAVPPPISVPAAIEPVPAATRRASGQRQARGWWWAAAGVAAGLVLVTTVVPRLGPAAKDPGARIVAVFPFTVRGASHHAYLAEGMVDLLVAKLEGTAGIRGASPRTAIAAAARMGREPGALDRAARQLGAGHFVAGEVTGTAGRLQLNAMLYEVGSTRPLATATVAGDTAALFDLVDGLAGQVLARLTSGRDTALTRLAAVSTTSLPALKAFLEGEQAIRAGHDTRAVAAFREAAALDTTFALAQYRLALAATWAFAREVEEPGRWAALAARNAGRLPPLARDLLAAYQAYRDGRADVAERLYRALAAAHPDNVEAWYLLGETLFHFNPRRGRAPIEAEEPFRRVLALDPGNAHAALHLAHLAMLQGDTAGVDSITASALTAHPDADRILELRALAAYARPDRDARQAITRAALGKDLYQVGGLLTAAVAYIQDPVAAMELVPVVDAVVSTPTYRMALGRALSDLAVASGNDGLADHLPPGLRHDAWRLETEALLAAEPEGPVRVVRARALHREIAATRVWPAFLYYTAENGPPAHSAAMQAYLLGLLEARLGDTAAAAARVRALEASPSFFAPDLAASVRAALARQRGAFATALRELQRFRLIPETTLAVLPVHWSLAERYALAEVLRALGRSDDALRVYESFVMLWDAPFYAPAHLRRAELYAQRGDATRARFHLGRADQLWRSAAPDYRAMLDRTRAALLTPSARRPSS